jgi:hypothetical protein
MKKFSILAILSLLLSLFACFMVSAEDSIKLVINGQTTYPDCQIINNRTFLPIRNVANALGIPDSNVIWNSENQVVTLMNNTNVVQIKIGSTVLLKNGDEVKMDTPPLIIDGRTYLPLAYIGQALGVNINWDASTRVITINSGGNVTTTQLISAPKSGTPFGVMDFYYSVNSANGVNLDWWADNLSGKIIKYCTLTVSTYNAVGDPSYDEINGKSKFSLKIVGPVNPGGSIGWNGLFSYQPVVSKIVIDELYLEFMDGTSVTQTYGYSTTTRKRDEKY